MREIFNHIESIIEAIKNKLITNFQRSVFQRSG